MYRQSKILLWVLNSQQYFYYYIELVFKLASNYYGTLDP